MIRVCSGNNLHQLLMTTVFYWGSMMCPRQISSMSLYSCDPPFVFCLSSIFIYYYSWSSNSRRILWRIRSCCNRLGLYYTNILECYENISDGHISSKPPWNGYHELARYMYNRAQVSHIVVVAFHRAACFFCTMASDKELIKVDKLYGLPRPYR